MPWVLWTLRLLGALLGAENTLPSIFHLLIILVSFQGGLPSHHISKEEFSWSHLLSEQPWGLRDTLGFFPGWLWLVHGAEARPPRVVSVPGGTSTWMESGFLSMGGTTWWAGSGDFPGETLPLCL